MLTFLAMGVAIDFFVAALGTVGFRGFVGLAWLDAFVDAAMVMTGNGPLHHVNGAPAKVFLALYALTGGAAYVIVVALVLAPALHRLLHVLHLRSPEDS